MPLPSARPPALRSSLFGLLGENGPCSVNKDGNVTVPRATSWNQNAHVVYVDQPPGTGFSFSDFGAGDTDEAEVAFDMYRFVQAWLKGNPALAANKLFIVGESCECIVLGGVDARDDERVLPRHCVRPRHSTVSPPPPHAAPCFTPPTQMPATTSRRSQATSTAPTPTRRPGTSW